ncbi:class I SAM-dependent methyltransferase [Microcoleus sp. T3_B1]|uniref:class I SAM-dependent methyltransferase n=1 Tax=unclassified Microcoleus TaxID=2642155 RepID=UPI002FD1D04F
MSLINNKEVYSTVEFELWADKKSLTEDEKYLIVKYLKKNEKTVEAGTAAGRILWEMKDLGFQKLYGYDYVPEFIEEAKQRDRNQMISFEVQDATDLTYANSGFEQIIYLQQIVCFIEEEEKRLKALTEAYRILKNGGTAVFSFLSFESRIKSPFVFYLAYLSMLRRLSGSNRSIQYIPWLKLGGKYNFLALLDRGPYPYWYKVQEAHQILTQVGFKIVSVGSSYQIGKGKMCDDIESLKHELIAGMLYFVCKK